MTFTSSASWFAVCARPEKEALADMHIRGLGYATFFPHYAPQWRPAATNKTLTELYRRAFLPPYLFVETHLDGISEINTLRERGGVTTVLYTPGGMPCPIPVFAMEELYKHADRATGLVYRNPPPAPKFGGEPGDSFRFGGASPLFGFYAEIVKVVSDERVLARLQSALFGIEGREVEVQVGEIEHLERRTAVNS